MCKPSGFASSEELALALGMSRDEAKAFHARVERLAGRKLKDMNSRNKENDDKIARQRHAPRS